MSSQWSSTLVVTPLTRWMKLSSRWVDSVWNWQTWQAFLKRMIQQCQGEDQLFGSFKWCELNPKLTDEIWMPQRQIMWLTFPNLPDNHPAQPVLQEPPLWVCKDCLTVSDEKSTKPEMEVVNNKSLWKTMWRKREKSNSIFQLPAEMSILKMFKFSEIRKFF